VRLVALLLAVAAAAQAPVAPPDAVGTAGTAGELVHIDVIVTDNRDKRIENLKAADFSLRDDGSPQAIDDVRLVKDKATTGA